MISLSYEPIPIEDNVPLVISRGPHGRERMLWVRLVADACEGWGEAGAFSIGDHSETYGDIERGLQAAAGMIREYEPVERERIERELRAARIPSAVIAAIDSALWDWLGKKVNLPVWQLWGLGSVTGPKTSVTVGISTPEAARVRMQQWLNYGEVGVFKIKLGSPAGIAADQAMMSAVLEALPPDMKVSVDANGGWSLADAIRMGNWLEERGVEHMEQPLPRGKEGELRQLRAESPLPIIVDESCFRSDDIPRLAALGGIDGINIKLFKCGGVSEAKRMIHVARAHNLRIMVGCYSETSLGNSVGATLGPMVDYLDLDSQFNLKVDPFCGVKLTAGRLPLLATPGFGVTRR